MTFIKQHIVLSVVAFAVVAFGAFGVVSTTEATSTQSAPRLEITQRAPSSVARGNTVEYTFTVRNVGTAEARNVYLQNNFTGALTFIPGSSSSQCRVISGTQNDIECRVASLAAGQSLTLRATVRVENTFTCSTNIVNRASVKADGLPNVMSSEARTQVTCSGVCTDPNPGRDLTGRFTGVSGGQVTNRSTNCSYEVGLASYKMFDRIIDNQEIVDSETRVIRPGETITLTVDIPACAYQIDLFHGRLLTSFANGVRYGNRIMAAEMRVTNNNFCSRTQNLSVTCQANPSSIQTGSSLTWRANATGGNGTYTYSWTGTDSLSGSSREVSKTYNTAGTKNATVTVTSAGQTRTAQCSATVTQRPVTPPPQPQPQGPVTIKAYKVVCDSVSDLPKWAGTNRTIDANTASQYVQSSNGKCRLVSDWNFQWGYGVKRDNSQTGVAELPVAYVGEANLGGRQSTGSGYNQWKTFGSTNSSGMTQVTINDIQNARDIWVREVLKSDYIPFTDGANSAEMWCHNDLENYDNNEALYGVRAGTYHCVAFNVRKTTTPPPPQPTNLNVTCEPNGGTYNRGASITWRANATGGTGSYSYSWTGTDSLNASSREVTKTYNSSGTKNATVTVTSGNQTDSAQCSINIENDAPHSWDVSCDANPSRVREGRSVTWTAYVNNAPGSVTYDWTGSDGLDSSSRTVTKTYNREGDKFAEVVVRSNGETKTARCNVDVFEDDNDNDRDLRVTCDATPRTVRVGERVEFEADVRGDRGRVRYEWDGPEGINDRSRSFTHRFESTGRKEIEITVRSNNDRDTDECIVNVIGDTVYVPPTQVAGVYLTQIPYTGLKENMTVALFLSALFAITGTAGYFFIRRKMNPVPQTVVAPTASHVSETPSVVDPKIAFTDHVETVARTMNASLSTDLIDALYASGKGNAVWASSALSQIVESHTSETEWKLITLESARKVYPHIG